MLALLRMKLGKWVLGVSVFGALVLVGASLQAPRLPRPGGVDRRVISLSVFYTPKYRDVRISWDVNGGSNRGPWRPWEVSPWHDVVEVQVGDVVNLNTSQPEVGSLTCLIVDVTFSERPVELARDSTETVGVGAHCTTGELR